MAPVRAGTYRDTEVILTNALPSGYRRTVLPGLLRETLAAYGIVKC